MSTTTPRTRALVAVGASAGGLLGAALFLMRHTRVVVDERHVTLRSPSQYALRCVRHLVALSNAVGNLDWRRVRTHSQRYPKPKVDQEPGWDGSMVLYVGELMMP